MQNIKLNSIFLYINFAFSTLFMLIFLIFHQNSSLKITLFLSASAISTMATIYLILYLISRAFFRYKITCVFLAIISFLINLSLIVDFVIYKVWNFHINAMVLNIITSPAAYDSLPISTSTKITTLIIVSILILSIFFICKFLKNRDKNWIENKNIFFYKRVLPLVLLLAISEKVTYGLSDIFAKNNILQSTKIIPLYQPLTFSKLANKFGIKKVHQDTKTNTIDKNSKLNYPKKEITFIESSKTPNIFIFMFDALRESIIDKNTTPTIMNLSTDSYIFKNHISGGDATRFGIFSFFYSLNSTYWFNFVNAHKEPVFFKVLKDRGYDIKIFSSTDTRWPEFRDTIYCGLDAKDIFDKAKGTPSQKDKISSKNFIDFIKNRDIKKPIFTFVFLDAPHGYSYPKEFDKFKPNTGNSGLDYLKVGKEIAQKAKNSYKNAVFYDDFLLKEMITTLKNKKLYNDSIIILSSDHGQEFFEYGFFGHNSSFSKAQVNSPFILKLPDNSHKIIKKMTSHLDVIPTLLSFLGVKNSPSDYAHGANLMDKNFSREFSYVAKWNKNAIITDKYTYIYSNLPNEIFKNEIRKNDTYKKVSKKDAPNIDKILFKVLEQNREFLK